MHSIIHRLYIANWKELQHCNINEEEWFVVNCTKDLPFIIDDINCIRVSVDDDLSDVALNGMFDSFSIVLPIIHNILESGRKVVVHCQAGQQRSPAIVCAYLMTYCDMSLTESVLFIKDRKPDAFFWKANFLPSLEKYANSL